MNELKLNADEGWMWSSGGVARIVQQCSSRLKRGIKFDDFAQRIGFSAF
jgi:hypothetical protein